MTTVPATLSLILTLVAAPGCSGKGGDPPPRATPTPAAATVAAAPRFQPLAPMPAAARRESPPPPLATSALAVGTTAPSVELVAATGAPWKLDDALAATDRVMLVFYRGDWCPFCRKQLSELEANLGELTRRRVAVVAISVDPVATNRHLADGLGLTFTMLADPLRVVTRGFGVEDAENEIAWPAIFVIGRDHAIEWRWLADTYRVRISAAELVRAVDVLPPGSR